MRMGEGRGGKVGGGEGGEGRRKRLEGKDPRGRGLERRAGREGRKKAGVGGIRAPNKKEGK